MGLKNLYYKLEDKYFDMLDYLEEKGINLYKIVDPLEKKGIPTFAIFLLLIFAIIGLIIFLLLPSTGIGKADTINLVFKDSTNNPLSSTEINISFDNQKITAKTDNLGVYEISEFEKKAEHILKITDTRYQFANDITEQTISEENNVVLLELKKESLTKKIYFKSQNGLKITDNLDVSIRCTVADFFVTETVVDGELTLSNIPINCGELIVEIIDRESDPYALPATEEVADVYLSGLSVSQEKGTLTVTVKDKDSKVGVSGLNIKIIDVATEQESDLGTTNNNGVFTSSNILLVNKTYKIFVSDPNGIYGSIGDLEYQTNILSPKKILSGSANNFEVELKKDVVGFIILKTVDQESNQVIPNVKVTLKKGPAIAEIKETGVDGVVRFGVKDTTPYIAVFDNSNYFIFQKAVTINSTEQEVKLKKVDSTNQNSLIVSVIDKDKYPIEEATIKLMDSVNNSLIKTATTDIYGKYIFTNLNVEYTYYIEAISGVYTGRSASNFTIKEREINEETVVLDIGEGTYNLTILDTQDSPVSTSVKVYEVSTNREMSEKATTTDAQGNTVIRIRADKSVYFVIDNFNRKFVTKNYNVPANTILKETIRLPRSVTSANIEFLGFFTSSGETITSISPGQSIIARFILNTDKEYSKAVAHIRTGIGDTCGSKTYLVEEDFSYIKQISYAGNKINGSTTYTPCMGEGKDLLSFTKRDGKWFNVNIDRPIVGSYLIDAEIVIKDITSQNQNVYYRAEFITSNTVSRFPLDSVLGTQQNTSSKQALYAYAKQQPIYVGSSNFCDNGICYSFSVFDKSTRTSRNIIDKYTAKENTDYQLQFRLNIDNKSLQDVSLNITSLGQGKTIKLTNYLIESVGSQVLSGKDNFDNIEIGNLSVNDYISGVIDLSIINDQSDSLVFSVVSNGEVVFTKNILFEIRESKVLVAEQLPTVLVPYVPNNILIAVTEEDKTPIANADVIVSRNNNVIDTGKTNSEGIFAYVLSATELDSTVDFTVKKQGYKTVILRNKITDQILTITPQSLDILIDVSKNYSEKVQVSLINNTILPLYISKIENNINNEYIDISTIINSILLDPAQRILLDVDAKLNEDGIELMTQKVITGDILLTVKEDTLGKEWVVKIPTTIRVTFGNSVNNISCLTIDPIENNMSLVTTEDVSEYTVTIKNNCVVDKTGVSLGRIFAELTWPKNKKYGEFSVVSLNNEYDLVENEKVQILPSLKANESTTLKIRFKPTASLKTMVAEPKIIFRTQRANVNGFDVISAEHISKIILNNYASCIELPKGTVQTMYCAMNQMMGNMYSNNFGYNPMAYDPTTMGYNQQQFGGQIGVPYYGSTFNSMQYPSLGYSQMMNQTRFQNFLDYPTTNNTTYTNQFGCPATTIQVKNNCADEAMIKFDPEYGITVMNSNEISVKKNAAANINIQGGAVLGNYKLSVFAKPADDTVEDYTYVKDVSVMVTLPVSTIPEGCIEIPKTEFDFSQLFPQPQKLVVYNNCRDYGYILQSLKLKNPNTLLLGDVYYFSIGDNNATLSPNKSTTTKDGKNIEVWSIDVLRKPDVQTIKIMTRSNNPAQTVTNIRTGSMLVSDTIVKKPILSVNYTNPRMQLQEMDKELKLIDNLQWLGLADETGTPFTDALTQTPTPGQTAQQPQDGELDPNVDLTTPVTETPATKLTPEMASCEVISDQSGTIINIRINRDRFDQESDFISTQTSLNACFDGDLYELCNRGLPKLTRKSFIDYLLSRKINSGAFTISSATSTITFPVKGEFRVCVSRPFSKLTDESSVVIDKIIYMNPDTNPVQRKLFDIKDPAVVVFNRSVAWNNIIYRDVAFSLTTELGGFESEKTSHLDTSDYTITTDAIDQAEGECYGPKAFNTSDLGYTGLDNYNKYGFNRLLFSWEKSEIKHNTCDYGIYYCDQDQLRVAMSKKVDLLKNPSKFVNLKSKGTSINFKLMDNSLKIEKQEIGNNLDINLQSEINNRLINIAQTTSLQPEQYYLILRNIINENVPDRLRSFAIITINAKDQDAAQFMEISEEIFKEDETEYFYKYQIDTTTYYSFTVRAFLDEDVYNKIININEANKDKYVDYLKDFLSTMDIYYGVTLSPFIVNTKNYGSLMPDSETDKIFTSDNWGSDLYKFKLNLDNHAIDISINTPQSLIIILSPIDGEDKDVNYSFSILDESSEYDFINPHKTNENFRKNIFFTTPINALYYNYVDTRAVPFVLETTRTTLQPSDYKSAKVYLDYSDWNVVQDGYIFTFGVNSDNKYIDSNFADIRPLQVMSTAPFGYNLEYYLSGNYQTLSTPTNWFIKNENNTIISSYTRRPPIAGSQQNEYTLLEYNDKPTLFKTTFFVFNNLNIQQPNTDQIRIISTERLLFNLNSVKTKPESLDYYKFVYSVPAIIEREEGMNINSTLIKYLIDGQREIGIIESEREIYDSIRNGKMCFSFNETNTKKTFKLWYNPSYKYNEEEIVIPNPTDN